MLYVVFTELKDDSIKKFEKIPFPEAVVQTSLLEKKLREAKRRENGEFYILDDEKEIYKGTFRFGTYEAPNLYIHILSKINDIKVDKEKEKEKTDFLEKMKEDLPVVYMVAEESIDKDMIDLDKRRISKLNKIPRRFVYGLGVASFIALVGMLYINITDKAQYEMALTEGRGIVEQQKELIDVYEKGLNGDDDAVLVYFESMKDPTDDQKRMVASRLIKEKKYKEVVEIYKDNSFVATLVSNSYFTSNKQLLGALKEFDALYPTNEAKYDIAYFEGQYDFLLKIPEVQMDARRSRMKTTSHLKLGQIVEAKAELVNNNDPTLKQKINDYELLTAEITLLQEKHKTAVDSKAEKEKINELAATLKEKKEALSKI